MNLFSSVMAAFLLAVFIPGPASADDAETIIGEFCQETNRFADEAVDELNNAASDLQECRRDFSDCRDGDFIGDDDPLVQCLSRGLTCTGRVVEDRGEACEEFALEFRGSYSDALAQARLNEVEDQVQQFFNTQSQERAACIAKTTTAVAIQCSLPSRLLR